MVKCAVRDGDSRHINPGSTLVVAMHSAWDQAGSGNYYAHREAFLNTLVDHIKTNELEPTQTD